MKRTAGLLCLIGVMTASAFPLQAEAGQKKTRLAIESVAQGEQIHLLGRVVSPDPSCEGGRKVKAIAQGADDSGAATSDEDGEFALEVSALEMAKATGYRVSVPKTKKCSSDGANVQAVMYGIDPLELFYNGSGLAGGIRSAPAACEAARYVYLAGPGLDTFVLTDGFGNYALPGSRSPGTYTASVLEKFLADYLPLPSGDLLVVNCAAASVDATIGP